MVQCHNTYVFKSVVIVIHHVSDVVVSVLLFETAWGILQQNAKHLQYNLIGYRCDKNSYQRLFQAVQNISGENPMRVANESFCTLSKFSKTFL